MQYLLSLWYNENDTCRTIFLLQRCNIIVVQLQSFCNTVTRILLSSYNYVCFNYNWILRQWFNCFCIITSIVLYFNCSCIDNKEQCWYVRLYNTYCRWMTYMWCTCLYSYCIIVVIWLVCMYHKWWLFFADYVVT